MNAQKNVKKNVNINQLITLNKDDMKNYMREYRKKHKQQKEDSAHTCTICNKLCKENEVEDLLMRSLGNLIKVIKDNIALLPAERIDRINDNSYDIFKYGDIINKTIEEIIKNNQNNNDNNR